MKRLVLAGALLLATSATIWGGASALNQTHKFTASVGATKSVDTSKVLATGRNIFEILGGTHDKSNISGYVQLSYDSVINSLDTTKDSVYLIIFTAWEGDLTPNQEVYRDSALTGATNTFFFNLKDSTIGGRIYAYFVTALMDSTNAGGVAYYSATAGLFARDHR